MADPLDALEDMIQTLKQQRDELRVQMHLGQAEAKREWEEMEAKWHQLEAKLAAAQDEAKAAGGDVVDATSRLGNEIAKAYSRIFKALKP